MTIGDLVSVASNSIGMLLFHDYGKVKKAIVVSCDRILIEWSISG